MKFVIVLFVILSAVGAINWGLVGGFNFNLVEAIFGQTSITKIVYILVGLSGVGLLASIKVILDGISRNRI
ncbi:MAG: hypothetical protein K0R49_207 [Burkholderiales bacterium]|jgi:uncharacterized membrane protein YuzA (DUF378 family)|nr:hypothetical protein [Burkholderiales bacterium]MCE3267955.1 hypothetical protein [Burkholderiales bacterium]